MRVIALHFEDKVIDGCQIYRVNMPLYHLGLHGHHTRVENFMNYVKAFRKGDRGIFRQLVEYYDLFVFPRTTTVTDIDLEGLASLVMLIRLMGKRVVYEVDDDFTNKHRDLRAFNVDYAMVIAKMCDAVTVTTPYLADLMKKETGLPTYVLPNMLDPLYWKRPEKSLHHEGLVIGLSGSLTHQEDWKIVEQPLRRVMAQDYGVPVTLRLTGFYPDYLREIPNTEIIPPLDYGTYCEMIRDCDIILAPVVPDDLFNLSKSPIKVIEGMGASRDEGGAAVVATHNAVYQLAIRDGKTGLLCEHTEESWYTAIDSLLRNPSLRTSLQRAGHSWVWKRHDITHTWTDWASAYRRILSKPSNTAPLPLTL